MPSFRLVEHLVTLNSCSDEFDLLVIPKQMIRYSWETIPKYSANHFPNSSPANSFLSLRVELAS